MKNQIIPHNVVLEFISNISFSKDELKDVQIAEQLASQSYSTMDQLADTARGYVEHKKKAFEKFIKDIPTDPYYNAYL